MIEEYISSKEISNLPKNINMAFKLGLEFKFKSKLNKMLNKEWFVVEEYNPPTKIYDAIHDFFKNMASHKKYNEFLKKKNRTTPVPSFEDMALMAFSKDKKCPIISNDNDITFFKEELFEKDLTYKIYNFNDLDTYNN